MEATTFTMTNLITNCTELFTGAMGWVGTLLSTIVGNPLLLASFLFVFIGFAVGLLGRIFRIS